MEENQLAAKALGLQLHSMEVNTIDQYESAFKGALKARTAAVAVTRHRLFTNYQKQIAELAAKYHLPAIHFREDFVERGGLMSYGADEVEPVKRVAVMIDNSQRRQARGHSRRTINQI